jgi:hypothetical protein
MCLAFKLCIFQIYDFVQEPTATIFAARDLQFYMKSFEPFEVL